MKKIYWVIPLVLIGTFLRVYRLDAFVTFLGDQGRDALIIKRLVTLEHIPAIGAPTSVGKVYLGPFYYYFIAPWLLLFKYNPLGLAVGVALFSSFYSILHYYLVKDLFNKQVALISTVMVVFSEVLISFSRFSWNPNLLPIFTFLTIYFVIKAYCTNQRLFYILAGSFLSFAMQLHYLAVFLFFPLGVVFVMKIKEHAQKVTSTVFNFLYFTLSFLFFSLPLVFFDLRHQFLNTKNFIALFKDSQNIASDKFINALLLFRHLNTYAFHITLNTALASIALIAMVIACIMVMKKGEKERLFSLFVLGLFLGLALYGGPKYPHYLAILYIPYYIFISYLLSFASFTIVGNIFIILFLAFFAFLNAQGYVFLYEKGSHQIEVAQERTKIMFDAISQKKFTVTSLPERSSDSTYRYFLEIWGKRPLEKDSLEKADELFVVCDEPCKPIGDPQWDIAYFAPRFVENRWNIADSTIYKLTR